MLLLKNPQFLPNLYETWSKWLPGKVSILTKSHTNWAKIVDFLIKAHFSMCPIFLERTLYIYVIWESPRFAMTFNYLLAVHRIVSSGKKFIY